MVGNPDYWCGVCNRETRLLSNGSNCPMCRLMRSLPQRSPPLMLAVTQERLLDAIFDRPPQDREALIAENSDLKQELKTLPVRLIKWLSEGHDGLYLANAASGDLDIWDGDPEALARAFNEWEIDEAVRYAEHLASRER